MTSPLRAAALAAAFLGASVLSSCGGGDASHEPTSTFGKQTAAQISEAAKGDMGGVRSLTIDGTAADRTFHASLDDEGNCVGWVKADGGTAKFIENADGSFVRADDAYWLAQASTAADTARVKKALKTWDGRWVRSPRGKDALRTASYFLPECDFASFVPALTAVDRTLATKGEEREIDGVDAVSLVADQSGVTSTMWVATDAPHRVVELTQSGDDAATYKLGDFDEPLDITTPDPDEVFDLAAANKKAE
ncbi:hypothetical protein [Nocardioides jejuensis]|uniref:LppX_LprAFG lipoprotein n=1 Tax=Nocardioides jejuensis TaxID=2502782 RepID=A0A4R1BX51_9ACTN|nr:hypothetical protein [Nocardioides jejuensis]TCJ21986.1 hypothetical protein EPD65_13870 [Nocardioides jejuensis]